MAGKAAFLLAWHDDQPHELRHLLERERPVEDSGQWQCMGLSSRHTERQDCTSSAVRGRSFEMDACSGGECMRCSRCKVA
jgi:hypothetical protein